MEKGNAKLQPPSIETATRWAQAAVALVVVVGLVLIGLEAIQSEPAQRGNPGGKTITKDTSQTKTTATGTETTKTREIATTSEDLVERTLGKAGPWFLRVLLVVLAAFLTGAAVQRVILGRFALKVGVLEVAELGPLPEPKELSPVPEEVAAAFEVKIPGLEPEITLEPGFRPFSAFDVLFETDNLSPRDYAVVNLGTGRSWLTTRLFILAILLKRMLSLKTFVFVESREGIDKKFIGVVAPITVRWALAREYPWLEDAYSRAYGAIPNHRILSESGALDEANVRLLLVEFISNVQVRSGIPDAAGEWEKLASDNWEHGQWMNRGLLERLVELSPTHSSVVDVGDLTPQETALSVLACEGSFVALIDDKRGFTSLVDRNALLEGMAARLVSNSRRSFGV